MKSNKTFLLALAGSLSLVACNSGSSSSTPAPAPTQYTFSSVSYGGDSTNCTGSLGTYTCVASGSSNVNFKLAYSSNPISYLAIPNQSSLPSGVTISTSGVCSTSPVSSYSCSITISSTGTAGGSTVSIPLNGSLGTQSFITITYQ